MTDFALPGLMPIDSPKWDVTPPFIALSSHRASDSEWVGIETIGPVTINGETPVTAAARIVLEFIPLFRAERDCVIFDTEEGADGIVEFESGGEALWHATVPNQPLPLTPGNWSWRIRFIDTADKSWELYRGIISVLP